MLSQWQVVDLSRFIYIIDKNIYIFWKLVRFGFKWLSLQPSCLHFSRLSQLIETGNCRCMHVVGAVIMFKGQAGLSYFFFHAGLSYFFFFISVLGILLVNYNSYSIQHLKIIEWSICKCKQKFPEKGDMPISLHNCSLLALFPRDSEIKLSWGPIWSWICCWLISLGNCSTMQWIQSNLNLQFQSIIFFGWGNYFFWVGL